MLLLKGYRAEGHTLAGAAAFWMGATPSPPGLGVTGLASLEPQTWFWADMLERAGAGELKAREWTQQPWQVPGSGAGKPWSQECG